MGAHHPLSLSAKAQQRLHFLRQLKRMKLPAKLLVQFYSANIESVLTSSITVWYVGATSRDKQRLQRIVCAAEKPPIPRRSARFHNTETCMADHKVPQTLVTACLGQSPQEVPVHQDEDYNNSFFPAALRCASYPHSMPKLILQDSWHYTGLTGLHSLLKYIEYIFLDTSYLLLYNASLIFGSFIASKSILFFLTDLHSRYSLIYLAGYRHVYSVLVLRFILL